MEYEKKFNEFWSSTPNSRLMSFFGNHFNKIFSIILLAHGVVGMYGFIKFGTLNQYVNLYVVNLSNSFILLWIFMPRVLIYTPFAIFIENFLSNSLDAPHLKPWFACLCLIVGVYFPRTILLCYQGLVLHSISNTILCILFLPALGIDKLERKLLIVIRRNVQKRNEFRPQSSMEQTTGKAHSSSMSEHKDRQAFSIDVAPREEPERTRILYHSVAETIVHKKPEEELVKELVEKGWSEQEVRSALEKFSKRM